MPLETDLTAALAYALEGAVQWKARTAQLLSGEQLIPTGVYLTQPYEPGKIPVVLVEPFQSRKTAEAVASRTGATVVSVGQFPGSVPGTDGDYLKLIDADVEAIASALEKAKGR